MSKEQITDLFCSNEIISGEFSPDVLRLVINSLKECGCVFEKRVPTKEYKYTLIENPFSLKFTDKEISLLNKFSKNMCIKSEWQKVLNLKLLFDKIALLIGNSATIEKLKNHDLLVNLDIQMIFDIQKYCENKNTVMFEYSSGKKITELEMVTTHLKFERGRLYVCGFSPKFNDYSYIRIDKIKSAKIVKISKEIKIPQKLVITYKMFRMDYVLAKNEVLKEKTDNYLLIEYTSENKFEAIQRFLEICSDCEVISPEFIRTELTNAMLSIVEDYENE